MSRNIQEMIYFPLLQKIGTNGPYQKLMAINIALQWLICGIFIMGPGFFFFEIEPTCSSQGYVGKKCQDYVCGLPKYQRQAYYINRPDTIPYAFGKLYVCEQNYVIDMLWTISTFGGIIIKLGFSFLMDNFGRKFSWVIVQGFTIFGYVLMVSTDNIGVFQIGMILGPNCSMLANTLVIILNEQVDNQARQQYQLEIQIAWSLGGLIIPWAFYMIPHWRTLIVITQIIPSIISCILLHWVQQNPKFLIRGNRQQALKIFAKIAKMNGNENNLVTNQDIEEALLKERKMIGKRKIVTPYDFLKYPSLKIPMVFGGLLLAFISIFYNGAQYVLGSFGLNIYANQTVLMITELLAFVPMIRVINKIPRRITGIIALPTSAFFTLLITLIRIPQGCTNCSEQYAQLFLVCIARFVCCAYFNVFLVYLAELFPEAARANGYNLTTIIQSIFLLIIPYLNNLESRFSISPMLVFTVCLTLGGLCCIPLKETCHKLPDQEIEQTIMNKQQTLMTFEMQSIR